MFLDNLLFFYDDFLDNIQPKMRKKLAVILLTIGALFMLSYSIIDDDFLEIGPGEGTLTESIFPYVNDMGVVELDPLLIKVLNSSKYQKIKV